MYDYNGKVVSLVGLLKATKLINLLITEMWVPERVQKNLMPCSQIKRPYRKAERIHIFDI